MAKEGSSQATQFSGLPGAELIVKGLRDLTSGVLSEEVLALQIAAKRLGRLGIHIPPNHSLQLPYEHRLYELLEERYGVDAFSRYNSLLRRLVSFSHALERERSYTSLN